MPLWSKVMRKQVFDQDYDYVFNCWVDMEGVYRPNDGVGFSIFGVNSHYNPEVLFLVNSNGLSKDESDVRAFCKGLLYDKYWSKSRTTEYPAEHFLFKNAWSCPYTRSTSLLDLRTLLNQSQTLLAKFCSNDRISEEAVRRRIRIYNGYF